MTGAEPSADKSDKNDEISFAFLPDRWPSQRQLIYQLCDIRDPEVQELIHANDSQEPHFVVSLCLCVSVCMCACMLAHDNRNLTGGVKLARMIVSGNC